MKKIGLGLGIIVSVAVVLTIGVTGAFFSDTETSTGNTFTTGSLDLVVAIDGQDQNPLNGPIFSLPDMKPDDSGEKTVSLKVNNNLACGFVNVDLTSDLDNSCTGPESNDEPGCDSQGTNNGELNDQVNFTIWKEADCNNIYEPQNNETTLTEGRLVEDKNYAIGELPVAPAKMCYGIAYCFGTWGSGMTCRGTTLDNSSQTDSFSGNLVVTAEQKRSQYPNGCPVDGVINPPPVVAPWINEIHYDNTGTDTNEGVEIAGKAGTDLTGWKVVLYNGNDRASYYTLNLSGTIPNEQGGYGTSWFARVGIQNGPDGLALVSPTGVVQFLSYEGSFTATNGPASGMTSVDIGVSEASNSPIDQSLQLQGTGNEYSQGIAQAKSDWMTTDFVPFEATLEFVKPEFIGDFSKRGFLILKKDNPSGLPEHDDALEITVWFQ